MRGELGSESDVNRRWRSEWHQVFDLVCCVTDKKGIYSLFIRLELRKSVCPHGAK